MKLSLLRSRGFGLILAAVVVLLAFAFVVARSGPLAPTRVTVTKVGEGQIAPALFGIGTVEAQRAYLIGPTAAGVIESRSMPSPISAMASSGRPPFRRIR